MDLEKLGMPNFIDSIDSSDYVRCYIVIWVSTYAKLLGC